MLKGMLIGAIGAEVGKMPEPGVYERFGGRGRQTVDISQNNINGSSSTTITHTKSEGLKTEAELTEDGELYRSKLEKQWPAVLATLRTNGISEVTVKLRQNLKNKEIETVERAILSKNKLLRSSETNLKDFIYDEPEKISILGLVKVLKSTRKARKTAEKAQNNKAN